MYLDTDVILALIKKEDWLKPRIPLQKLTQRKTSALTIIEVRLILLREHSREEALEALSKIKKLKIKITPVNEKIVQKSNDLMKKYASLGIFDAIHAAGAMVNQEELISTDTIYREIKELRSRDPRYL